MNEQSEWTIEGNRATHTSGMSVIVMEGSFRSPLLITFRGGREFNSVEQAGLIRAGLNAGRLHEKQSNSSFVEPCEVLPFTTSTTKVTVKRKRLSLSSLA